MALRVSGPRRYPQDMMDAQEWINTKKIFTVHPFAREILTRLQKAGHDAYLIGGVVRDALLAKWEGREDFTPEEVDIATAAMPTEIRTLFSDRPIIGVGEEFGVLVIVAPDGHQYEVATFRTEADYDGRWPGKVNLMRDLAGDVHRRDLTINGLAAARDGTVIDLVNGIFDLKAKVIRTIGDPRARFSEDYLRMLRTVRFACQIDGQIDPATAAAIKENADHITEISWERIRDELLRLLKTTNAARGLELLDRFGLLHHILPEIEALKGVPQPEEYHPEGDVYVHTIGAVRVADGFVRDPLVKLAILLHDIGKPKALARSGGAHMGGHEAIGERMAKRIGTRLRLSRSDLFRLAYLVKNHMRIAAFPRMGRGKQVRFLTEGEAEGEQALRRRYPLFFDLLQVLIADSEASAHRAAGWAPVLKETLRVLEHIEHVGNLNRARKLINGHTLIQLGLKPGPRLGAVLNAVHDRILSGEIKTKEEAIAAARALITTPEQDSPNTGHPR